MKVIQHNKTVVESIDYTQVACDLRISISLSQREDRFLVYCFYHNGEFVLVAVLVDE